MAQGLYDITPLEHLITQGYTLLTPNYRLARRIKAQWDARCRAAGKGAWEPLPVQPLETWLLQQWEHAVGDNLVPPLVPLTANQTLELWRQVIGQQESRTGDFHLLRPSAAAELASQARDSLLRWQVDTSAGNIRSLFELDGDCRTFLQWLIQFEKRLANAGQCTLTDCLAHLSGLGGRLPAARVALVEFDLLAPLPRAVLQALCAEVLEVSPSTQVADRLVHAFNDKRSELHAVASWAADLQRCAPHTTIGIVLSDMTGDRVALEYLLRRQFDCLGHNYASLPINFSTGIPLAQAPLVRDALLVLAMGLQQTTIAAVTALLRSRFLDLPDAQSALSQRFVRQLYAQGRAVLPIADLRSDAARISLPGARGLVLGRYLNALYGMRDLRRKALPSVWMLRFSEILRIWGWPGTQTLDSLEYQQLHLWQRTLDEFGTFDILCEPVHFGDALALLRDCCQRQVSQPQTADSPIQVLGPLEAAGLSFERLWVCGMQSADWPASARPNPFIPMALQTRLQMPHASPEREWGFADALLKQYARSSQVLHASYCRQIDGVPDLPSALLQDFTPQVLPAPALVSAHWLARHAQGTLEEFADHGAPGLNPEQLSVIQGGSGLLEDQSQCPFRAFARHRLQVEPLAALTVALSVGERGALLHEALNALWEELRDHATLQALTATQEEQTVMRAAQSAVAKVPHYQQRKTGAAFWQLETTRLTALLREWLCIERQRTAFVVEARELDIALELASLPIRLRADRIDQLPDGSRVIIDYKSGSASVQDWFGERPRRPQLLLYSIAEPQTIAGLAFARVHPRDCRFIGLGRIAAAPGISTDLSRVATAGAQSPDWSALNERWRDTLERLAQEFVAGEAQVDPLTPSSCTWCGLQPLCRIDDSFSEHTLAASEETG